MSTCCAKGMDYVIVARKENTEATFSKEGYDAAVRTDGFLLYRCQGYNGYKQDLYKDGQIAWIQYYDELGNPAISNNGYSLVRYEYINGNLASGEYFDSEGRKTTTPLGYCAFTREYSVTNRFVSETYYGINDELLYRVSEIEKDKRENLFHYVHCSDGVNIKDEMYILSTSVSGNRFNHICFQLYDAKTEKYLIGFGKGETEGIVSGQYVNDYPDGLYRLVIKGNTNLFDESVYCYVFLQKDAVLDYSYTINQIDQQHIVLSNLSVQIVK